MLLKYIVSEKWFYNFLKSKFFKIIKNDFFQIVVAFFVKAMLMKTLH